MSTGTPRVLELTNQLDEEVKQIFSKLDGALAAPYGEEAVEGDEARIDALLDSLEEALQEKVMDTLMPLSLDKSCAETISVLSTHSQHA